MRGGSPLRRAVAASLGLHALLAAVLVVFGRWHATRPDPLPRAPGIDTRADVRLHFTTADVNEPVEAPVVAPPAPPVEAPAESEPRPSPPPLAASAPPEAEPGGLRPPLAAAPAVPRTLPSELLDLLKKPRPVGAAVVEVPVTPGAMRPASPGPVQPAAATSAGPPRPALDGGAPVHGALGAGQTVVYVLDASGSMGEWGKFDAARRALAATLRKQPATVRFQVVVYAGFAFQPLPAPASGCVPATPDNVERMAAALLALGAPAGRSDHLKGLHAALDLRPDVVLFLTDADGLPAGNLRGVLRQAAKPVALCVATVTATGVKPPMEVK